jgi:hypothetical protein
MAIGWVEPCRAYWTIVLFASVQSRMPIVGRCPLLEFEDDVSKFACVEAEQVDVEVFVSHLQVHLSTDEGEPRAELEQGAL